MPETSLNQFTTFKATLDQHGVDTALAQLTDSLRASGKYHELFEALKMQVRRSLGLPITYSDLGDDLGEAEQTALQDGLLTACREVGMALLSTGKVREGWMYLQPVGDKRAVAEKLSELTPHEENLDEFVEVALYENVDPARGYGLVLEHYGTCNAITTLENLAPGRDRASTRIPISLLVRHVHTELSRSLRADITQQQGTEPQETTLAALVADRDWLFGEYSYHLDTSHLASTIRLARRVDDPDILRLALDLTAYGTKLNAQFQYPGEPPFEDLYPAHALYFSALLGERVDEALNYFREQAEGTDVHQMGTAVAEVYIDLLSRIQRYDDAIEAWIEMVPAGAHTSGLAPGLLELAEKGGRFQRLVDHFQQREDLLAYATGLMQATLHDQSSA